MKTCLNYCSTHAANVSVYKKEMYDCKKDSRDKTGASEIFHNTTWFSPVCTDDMPWSYVNVQNEKDGPLFKQMLVSKESYIDAMLFKAINNGNGCKPVLNKHLATIPGVLHIYKTTTGGACVYLMVSENSACKHIDFPCCM